MTTLLHKLIEAEGADRTLDHAIGEMFGWEFRQYTANAAFWFAPGAKEGCDMPSFTASIDAAIALVERVKSECSFELHRWYDQQYGKDVFEAILHGGGKSTRSYAHSNLAIALLIALLRSNGKEG